MGKSELLTAPRQRGSTHAECGGQGIGIERLSRVVNAVCHDR